MKKRISIMLFVLFYVFNSLSFAQGKGSITGVIRDNQGDFLPGATVYLQDLQKGGIADNHGKYEITNVPDGKHKLVIGFIGFDSQTLDVAITSGGRVILNVKLTSKFIELDDVVVTSIRKGQVKALTKQQNAENITNVLSHEEIAKYPDVSSADAMKRMPGVSILTSAGEGTYVSIRGTSPALTSITINGQKTSTPVDGERFVGLDVINASQLEMIEVSKTLTPDLEGDAIGGSINLITKSAFDREKTYFNVKASSGMNSYAKDANFNTETTFSTIFGAKKNFGFTIGASWNRSNINAQEDEFSYGESKLPDGTIMPNAIQDFYIREAATVRNRQGINMSFDFRANENHRFFINGMLNRRTDELNRNSLLYRPGKGNYLTSTTVSKGRMGYDLTARNEIQSISMFSAGGISKFGKFNADYGVSYGLASEVKDKGYKSAWQLNQKSDFLIDNSDIDYPIFTATNLADGYIANAANWDIDTQDWRKTETTNNNLAVYLNFKTKYRLGSGDADLKFGAKYRDENKTRDNNRIVYKWTSSNKVMMNAVARDQGIDGILDGRYNLAPMIDYSKYDTFFETNRDKALVGAPRYDDSDGIGGAYDAFESVTGAYAMTSATWNKFKAMIGLRDEYTSTSYQGVELLYDPVSGALTGNKDVTVENSYNKIFPHLHLQYNFNKTTDLRFAATTGIARPKYFELAPYRWINGTQITKGNPELKPTNSMNFDLMFGHYMKGIGVLNAGVFGKKLTDIMYTNAYLIEGGIYDGYLEQTTVNGDNASLYGFEISWMQQFTFLPGFLNGFGIYSNYTYTASNTDFERMDANKAIRHITTLPGQLGNVGNIGLNYEKYRFNARLSLYFAQYYLSEVRQSAAYDVYRDNYNQLDFTCSYVFKKYIELFANVNNITNSVMREYWEVSSRPRVNQMVGTSFLLGVKFSL